MIYNYDKKLVAVARSLRKDMTPQEKRLWYDFFKKLPLTVNRQKNIGNYIVDFFIASKRVVVEIDGAQHKMPKNVKADKKRDFDLQKLGIKVLRYTNPDVDKDFETVCEDILSNIGLTAADLKQP